MKPCCKIIGVLIFPIFMLIAASVHAYPTNTISKIYVFGDSLSDMGNGLGAPVTNGETWAYYLATELLGRPSALNQYRQQMLPSSAGGTDYAYVGAQVGTGDHSATSQINDYLQQHSAAQANAVYIIWIGGNDILVNPNVDTTALADQVVIAANKLVAAGASKVYIMGLPDMSKIPGLNPAFGQASQNYDARLSSDVQGTGVQYLDTVGMFNQIYNNYPQYGLTNRTDSYVDINCAQKGDCNPNHYMFWAGPHPTAPMHMIIATQICNAIAGGCLPPAQ